MTKARSGSSLACLLVAVSVLTQNRVALSAPPGPRTDPAMMIHIDRGRLTVKLKDVQLTRVLEEIGRKARIEMVILGVLPQTVSTEFRDLSMEEGLQRLLRGCGWLAAGRRGGALEKIVVTPFGDPTRAAPPSSRGSASTEDASASPGRVASTTDRGAPKVAELTGREPIRSFLDTLLHSPDQMAKVNAFRRVVNSVNAEEVGMVLGLLQDDTVPPSEWEAALVPLANVASPEERAAIVQGLQKRELRQTVVNMLGQLQVFKSMEERR